MLPPPPRAAIKVNVCRVVNRLGECVLALCIATEYGRRGFPRTPECVGGTRARTALAEVLQMKVGEKAKLEMTPDFGYGAQGAGGVIPPNADLIFEVELIAIN